MKCKAYFRFVVWASWNFKTKILTQSNPELSQKTSLCERRVGSEFDVQQRSSFAFNSDTKSCHRTTELVCYLLS